MVSPYRSAHHPELKPLLDRAPLGLSRQTSSSWCWVPSSPLREEAGLTIEKLAYESELGSKGHLSTLERGLARPTIQTLQVLADRLEVKLLDLVTFPDEDDRAKLIDRTRAMNTTVILRLLKNRRK
jgi:hypothetical protein